MRPDDNLAWVIASHLALQQAKDLISIFPQSPWWKAGHPAPYYVVNMAGAAHVTFNDDSRSTEQITPKSSLDFFYKKAKDTIEQSLKDITIYHLARELKGNASTASKPRIDMPYRSLGIVLVSLAYLYHRAATGKKVNLTYKEGPFSGTFTVKELLSCVEAAITAIGGVNSHLRRAGSLFHQGRVMCGADFVSRQGLDLSFLDD